MYTGLVSAVCYVSEPDKHHLVKAAKEFGVPEALAVTDFRRTEVP